MLTNELNIIMVAPRRIGKTSLLAAMHEEFHKTFERANLQTWTDDSKTLQAITECKQVLKTIDPKFQKSVKRTDSEPDPWDDEGFVFELGSGSRKFIKLRFTDPSGEYFKLNAAQEQKEYIKQQLLACDAVIIPIDATALMEKKTGRVNYSEVGTWHEEKNEPERITTLLKYAYAGLTDPRLIILAPVKCETYMRTSQDAENLLQHVQIGYRELLNFLKSDGLFGKVAVVVTPVQTVGNAVFAYHKTGDEGFIKFEYNKTEIKAPYAPKDGDQPLRYVLRFLLNLSNEEKKRQLEQDQKELAELEKSLSLEKDKLDEVKQKVAQRQKAFREQQQLWFPFRSIDKLFDDKYGAYKTAQENLKSTQKTVQDIQTKVQKSKTQVQATQEEIKIFNNAIFSFAIGCKNSDGFAILQGAKWLPIPHN
jgi:Double-GTPase 2